MLLGTIVLLALVTSASPTPSSDREEITWRDLLSVWVPSLCEHPGGRLMGGRLPGIPPGDGEVSLASSVASAADGREHAAFGDLTGDGRADAAVVVYCDRGGVEWPRSVQLYDADAAWLGGVELADVVPSGNGRASVWRVAIAHGTLSIEWTTGRESDAACCSSLDASVRVSARGGRLRVADPEVFDERSAAEPFLDALRRRDRLAAAQLAPAQVVDELLDSMDRLGTFMDMYCTPTTEYDSRSVVRWCLAQFSRARLRLSLERTGFRSWHLPAYDLLSDDLL